jgi:hypothetical protein
MTPGMTLLSKLLVLCFCRRTAAVLNLHSGKKEALARVGGLLCCNDDARHVTLLSKLLLLCFCCRTAAVLTLQWQEGGTCKRGWSAVLQ